MVIGFIHKLYTSLYICKVYVIYKYNNGEQSPYYVKIEKVSSK